MARGQKKETLTPEERLQAALVPESEQPYKVPGNWCWVKVGEFSTLYRGVSYKKQDAHTEKQDQDYLILRGGNILEGTIDTEGNDNVYVNQNLVQNDQLVQPYDIIIVSSTGSSKVIGRAGISYEKYNDVAFGAFLTLVRPNNGTVKPFIAYYFQSSLYRDRIRNLASGININNIKAGQIAESTLPLPPLPEQQRIVARIESLFAKLDEAKQKAQDALDSFETRKAAILHKAFTGELSAKWRKEHGVGMESWENVSVSEICHSLKYGTAKKSSSEGTVVVIRMGNLQDGEISWDDLAYSDDEEDIEKYKLMPGDVLFNRTNSPALVGKTSIYRGEYPAIYAGYLIKLDYDHSRVIGDYLNYSLNTVSAKEYCNSVKIDGVNQSNINAQKIGAYRFDMPKINEQSEIVRLLDALLAKEQQAKGAVEAVLDQIDLIKKAILARAFRGELGTNDPAEESAVELIKQIIQKEGESHAN